MNRLPLILVACILAAPAVACDGGPLFEMIEASLPAQSSKNFDVAEVESTEGGEWDVYYAPDGKTLTNLVRNDYGESGRWQARLVVSSPVAYAITATHYIYSAMIYTSGQITMREEKDLFVFCGGKLLLPEEDFLGIGPEYEKKAAEAWKTFDAPEVGEYVKGLKR